MKPLLTRQDYLSEAVLQAERECIFFRQWQFAAVSLQLPNHHDYTLVNIAGKEVIVQNFEGRYSAFTNVCSHRYSAIHVCPKGNRPLQCPYHRWAYDSEGVPRGIPERAHFSELREGKIKLEDLRLERWQVALCGTLIFVRLAIGDDDLEAFLGDQFSPVEKISNAFETEILSSKATYKANWKLVIQNTLEAYHVPSVHPDTFGRFAKVQLFPEDASPPHLRYYSRSQPTDAPAPGSTKERLARSIDAVFAKSGLGASESSTEIVSSLLLIWPTTTLGHTNGRAFVIFSYAPIAPNETALRISQWYPRLLDASDKEESLRQQFQSIITGFVNQVTEEDREACETVQRGIGSAGMLPHGLIGDQEAMVHLFQKRYRALMDAG